MSTLTEPQVFCPLDNDGDGDCAMCSKNPDAHLSESGIWVQNQMRGTSHGGMPDFRLNLMQDRCIKTLCSTNAIYNIPLMEPHWSSIGMWNVPFTPEVKYQENEYELQPMRAVELWPDGIVVRVHGTMSTFDCDRLTRLVLAAHRNLCRVEVSAGTHLSIDYDNMTGEEDEDGFASYPATHMEIRVTARRRDGFNFERHPSVADLRGQLR